MMKLEPIDRDSVHMNLNNYKLQAAEIAVNLIQSGMIVGLGSGSTASLALQILANKLKDGTLQHIHAIPSSVQIEQQAKHLGIPLTTLEEHGKIDLTIDGADEVDEDLYLIKGGGGALLREKIVAQASRRVVIIVDESKWSKRIGFKWPVPIEVLPFGWGSQALFLEELGAKWKLRKKTDGSNYLTDQGNYILDSNFGAIEEPLKLSELLANRAGIIEHGLFIDLTDDLIMVGERGSQHLKKNKLPKIWRKK
ncbi:MAG: ribose-5-phosphate isomerase RpiA [Anaerolineaceae bacterium]|nr:ribose-5-phosphate isomerase RpiA [Anaerolineaceae bacterium]